ncbi:Fc.00g097970.m01.CDS01 [Cosmosporella sp. VM-42]
MSDSIIPAWTRDKGLRSLYLWLPIIILSSSYQGFDGMIMNGLQLLPSWQEEFDYPNGPILGLLNSIQTVGAMVALPFITPIVDKFGRRKSIFFGAAWTILGAVLQASSKDIPQFVIARFLIGFGLAYTVVGAPLLLAELALPKHRGAIISYFPTCWYLGAIVAAWVTYGTHKLDSSWSWRIPSLLQGIPAIIQLFLIWFVPESPRWLISKGRGKDARDLLVKHHGNGDERNALVELEYQEIKESIESDSTVKSKTGWLDLVRTAGNRRRLIIVFFAGLFIEISGNGLVQYYLHSVLLSIGITNTTTQVTINGCLSIYNFVVASAAALFVEGVGRRRLFIISTAGMFLAFILWTTFAALYTTRMTAGYGIGVLVAIFISNGFYDIGWTILWAYPTEILAYETRARGVVLQTGIMHAFGFFGTFVNPIGLQSIGWKYYLAYVVYTFIELVVVWYFFVETKGFTLEEIATIFDTEGLSWKQRRNMKPPPRLSDFLAVSETGDVDQKDSSHTLKKRLVKEGI